MRSLFQRFDITDESGRVTSYVVRVAGSKDDSFGDRLSIGKYLYLWKGRKRVWTFRRYATRICN